MTAVKQTILNASEIQETIEDVVIRLAALPLLEYEQVREETAKSHNVRISVLDEEVANKRNQNRRTTGKVQIFPPITPWPHAVGGVALLNELLATVKRFIICADRTAIAIVLWIVFTWVIDHVQVAPLGVITAPEKRCGKSQLLNLIGRLCRRPMVASNISPAAVYRVIEAYNPTVLLDEADSFLKDNEELRGVINSGHTRQIAYVIRTVGDAHEPKQFSTWGAKAISGIGVLSETLMDRAITFTLRRKLPSEKVERLRHAEANLFERLTSMLARWAQDNGRALSAARPALPDTLNDRAQDNWEPLLSIADCVGGNWPKLARDAANAISGKEESFSLSAELLADIRKIINKFNADRISTADLLHALNADELAPWATYNHGKPMSPRQLAKRLGEYGIKPNSVRIGDATPKGYLLNDFNDAFNRYLSTSSLIPDLSITPQQIQGNADTAMVFDVADSSQRCGKKEAYATDNPLDNNTCGVVADKNPTAWVEESI